MLPAQDIWIIRHAERCSDGITEQGELLAQTIGQVIMKSVCRQVEPDWIALFDCQNPRVQKTMQAIKNWMNLSPNNQVYTLPLDGEYLDVSESEIRKAGIVIRNVIDAVWTLLIVIVTNKQYVAPLANSLWKYWLLSNEEKFDNKYYDGRLNELQYIHWKQKRVWDVPRNFLDIMWNNFGKTISLQELAKEWGKNLYFSETELKNYMKERAWYFDIRNIINRIYFKETTGISVDSDRIITFFPKIEQRNNDLIAIMPTQEEFTAELIRASSYLWYWDIPFISPIDFLKYHIFRQGNLFSNINDLFY